MPGQPELGAMFEQELVPGVAEDLDPLDDVAEHKFYCAGVGLVREVSPTGSIDLMELERTGG